MSGFNKLASPKMRTLDGKNKRLFLFGATLLTGAALAFGVWFYMEDMTEPASFTARPAPPLPAVGKSDKPLLPAREENATPAPVQLHSSVSSRQLSDLLTQKQLKEAELAVKELEKKLSGLEPAVSAPTLIMSAQASADNAEILPKVRSIKGLDGRLKAVLSGGGVVKTVMRGDAFLRGTVERIGLGGVDFRSSDGAVHTLMFEE